MERKVSTLSTLVDSTLDRAAGLEGFNPDELLEKLSVSEVKGVQQKLRHNAEAKQQELRLMVGVGNATAICCRPLPRLRPWQNPLSVC